MNKEIIQILCKRAKRKFNITRHHLWGDCFFIHINKTGGSSIRQALGVPQQHITASNLIKEVGLKRWKSRFTFSVVRNPWDRVVSLYLRKEGIQVSNHIVGEKAPQMQPIYQHYNSRTLAEVIRPMLKYSTNFIANQLALTLAADAYKQPANAKLVKRYMNRTLQAHFHWKSFNLQEGAGLSRKNRLKPTQLVDLLHDFPLKAHAGLDLG